MLNKIKNIFYNLVSIERSAKKLTQSFCLGSFIALTPTIPLQTPLIFVFSWLFGLSAKVTFVSVYLINNPITMLFIYVADYKFGDWLLNTVLKLDMEQYNPVWTDKFSIFLNKYISLEKYLGGSVLCFWCFIIGGIVLPLLASIVLYFIMYPIFKKLIGTENKN